MPLRCKLPFYSKYVKLQIGLHLHLIIPLQEEISSSRKMLKKIFQRNGDPLYSNKVRK